MNKSCLLLLLATGLSAFSQILYPEVMIEVRVVDEIGKAVTNAEAVVSFRKLKTNNPFDGQETTGVRGYVDAAGIYAATNTTLGTCGAGCEKPGYYSSRDRLELGKNEDGKWIPWHQVIELKLRKKVDPIPMYARKLERLVIPAADVPVGYDLKTSDWVAPHGKGTVSDIVWMLRRVNRNKYSANWEMTIQVPGGGNGLQSIPAEDEFSQSDFRFPRAAYEQGYSITNIFMGFKSNGEQEWETNSVSATNFFFRVRSEYDVNGKLKSALYGKLLGPIRVNVQGTATAKLYFTYYLNPTPLDRNMEFDPQKNLLKNLSSMEQVYKP